MSEQKPPHQRAAELAQHHLWAYDRAEGLVHGWDAKREMVACRRLDLILDVAEALVKERGPGGSKYTCGLNDDSAKNVGRAVYAIEADDYARHQIWKEMPDEYKEEWESISVGGMDTIGHIKIDGKSLPVVLHTWFAKYKGKVLLLYNIGSQVADHRMAEAWLEKRGIRHTDANNWRNALGHIDRMVTGEE